QLRPGFFHRLWSQLHSDARRLPYGWFMEGNRLCCRLRSVPPEQRHWLECERVADHPEIELRILSLPRRPSVLAEVVFPTGMGMVRAKEFIFKELQELPVQAYGRRLKWKELPDKLVLHLADGPLEDAQAVSLSEGVRELIAPYDPPPSG